MRGEGTGRVGSGQSRARSLPVCLSVYPAGRDVTHASTSVSFTERTTYRDLSLPRLVEDATDLPRPDSDDGRSWCPVGRVVFTGVVEGYPRVSRRAGAGRKTDQTCVLWWCRTFTFVDSPVTREE